MPIEPKKSLLDPDQDPDHEKYVTGTETPGPKPTREDLLARAEEGRLARLAALFLVDEPPSLPLAPETVESNDLRLARLRAHADLIASKTAEEIAQMHHDTTLAREQK